MFFFVFFFCCLLLLFFFFQAEDGIRDYDVTGVQTCALPIFLYLLDWVSFIEVDGNAAQLTRFVQALLNVVNHINLGGASYDAAIGSHYSHRSEERLVGKECRSRWSPSP